MPVTELPRPEPFRATCAGQRIPGSSCCWYHSIDWRHVCAAAVHLLEAHDWTEPQNLQEVATQLELSPDRQMALCCLLWQPIDLAVSQDGTRSFVDGQHRVQAMMDQGVRITVIGVPGDD